MGSQASKGGVAVEGKAADADPAAVKTNGQVIHLHLRHTHIWPTSASARVAKPPSAI